MNISARSAVRSVHDAVRTQLWPIPVVAIVLAVAMGVMLPFLDARVDDQLPPWLGTVVFNGDSGAARTVLDAVASSLITVTSLTFSLTVVTLQLASSQFSPRLLRTFTQDIFVQVTLALFLATFTFSLTVLRAVRSSETSASPFVPRLSVTTAFLLAIVSVVALVLFLAHLTRQIRVETMLGDVHRDASETIATTLGPRSDPAAGPPARLDVPEGAETLWAWTSGFLLQIDLDRLCRAAAAADLTVAVQRFPGDFVVHATPLGAVWAAPGRPCPPKARRKFDKVLRAALHFGPERTATQDVGYGLRQLTDVANKALSPGINDPTTAIHALGHTAAVLAELTGRDLGPLVLHDDDDTPRVVVSRPRFADFLDLALTQPRTYGKADCEVMTSLYTLLRDVACRAHPEHRPALAHQLHRLHATVQDQDFDAAQLEGLAEAERGVRDMLTRPRADRPSG